MPVGQSQAVTQSSGQNPGDIQIDPVQTLHYVAVLMWISLGNVVAPQDVVFCPSSTSQISPRKLLLIPRRLVELKLFVHRDGPLVSLLGS